MLRTLSDKNRKILASCSGTLLLIILLLLASLDIKYEVETPPKIIMHEVQMYSLPPPPPTPIKQEGAPDSQIPSLVIANAEGPVRLDIMELEVDIESIAISGFGTGGPGGYGGDDLGWGGQGGWGTFSISELDKIPIVISAPTIEHPKEALDRDILDFEVKLHIVIDEAGRTYPISILENPFPSKNKEILEFASEVRFTPPTKQGVPVKAEYRLNVMFHIE